MRAYPADYEVHVPDSVTDALARMAEGRWRPLAGGTDLMVLFEAGKLPAGRYLSLWGLSELKKVEETPEAFTLGALTTYTEIRRHPGLQREFPSLCRAAAETGALAIQNRGTLGGNIANASPAADSPPVLLVHDAELELISLRGARWLPYRDFHLGYKKTALAPDELISRIRLPRTRRPLVHWYRKVGTRKAQSISKVCFAAAADKSLSHVRLAFGSVAPVPLRCLKTEALLTGRKLDVDRAVAALEAEIAPIDDIRSTGAYRRRVAGNLLRQFLEAL